MLFYIFLQPQTKYKTDEGMVLIQRVGGGSSRYNVSFVESDSLKSEESGEENKKAAEKGATDADIRTIAGHAAEQLIANTYADDAFLC